MGQFCHSGFACHGDSRDPESFQRTLEPRFAMERRRGPGSRPGASSARRDKLPPSHLIFFPHRIWLLILFWFSISFPQQIDTSLINRGIEEVFDNNFEEARQYILAGSKNRKDLSDFLLSWIQLKENDSLKMKAFGENVKKQILKFKQRKEGGPPDARFLCGLWNGLMALFLVEEHKMLSAYKFGRRGFELLRECLMYSPGQYDAYFGLGLYHKMKYELGGSLWFVPQSSKDGEIARKYFKLALKKGIFTRELSRHMLIELSFI
ncbi:hypothetical protein ACFL5V_01375 [Fibrobacterota bacterium]